MIMDPSASSSSSSPSSSSQLLAPHWALYPGTYVVNPAPYSLTDQIDGDISKDVWKNVPWSEPWQDIQGDDVDEHGAYYHKPSLTRFKALYDDTHLYIAALLDPSPDFNTKATFTQRNDPIYRKDSDFEIFVDVWGSNHNYKELEVNPWNTIWNLLLDRPYVDNGSEHSGRIARPGDKLYYEVYNQKTATKVLTGTVNDSTGAGAQWSVEAALAYEDLFATPLSLPKPSSSSAFLRPKSGTFWRVNFSRVELDGNVNWTWKPQRVWNPATRSYQGQINMHLPDAWGYFAFASETSPSRPPKENDQKKNAAPSHPPPRDPFWPLRITCMNIYYAQQHFHEQVGQYATNLQQLHDYVDPALVLPFASTIQFETTTSQDETKDVKEYRVTVHEIGEGSDSNSNDRDGIRFASIRQDRLIEVGVLPSMDSKDSTNQS